MKVSSVTFSLFDENEEAPWQEAICPGAVVLRRYARRDDGAILAAVAAVLAEAPLRHLQTPGGLMMSVAMSNCGLYGWVSDRAGYRYASHDPHTDRPWPAMPALLQRLASGAADAAGFPGFAPDACLINSYQPGAKLSLHQDRDERDMAQPIVSVSLGVPASFQFGGPRRADRTSKILLTHGDVVVWGGPARLYFHGVLPLKTGHHPLTAERRINLTFRVAR